MLREFYRLIANRQGIDLKDLHFHGNDQDSARSHIEFSSTVVTKFIGTDTSRDEDPVSFLRDIECPMLCIYGEKDQKMSESPGIIRKVFANTSHDDFVVKNIFWG